MFGIPDIEDPDPYGVKALEAEGLNIREAGTHSRPSAEVFEFKPAPTSPIYPAYRRSVDSPLRGRTNSWRGSMHSLASIDRGTQTDEDDKKSASHSPEKQDRASPVLKETEHVNESDESDTPYDEHENAEIETATPVLARARVVSVQKRPPPTLPPRNPTRVSTSALSTDTELNDGFDQVQLNGAEHETNDYVVSPIEQRAEEDANTTTRQHEESGAYSLDGTAHSAENDDDFQSTPSTPAERRDDIPGSFN